MCWNMTATVAMAGAGAIAAAVTWRRGAPTAVPLALGWFALMEMLQIGGIVTVDQCGTPANEAITHLSILHIVFQPLIINAFVLSLAATPPSRGLRLTVYGLSAASAAVMLMQLHPFAWAGSCPPGAVLCGPALCTVSGDWHIAWDVPYNGLLQSGPLAWAPEFGWGFPTYMLAVFLLPLLYGAWRFVLFHVAVGPLLASQLTGNPNEIPAIWCLFSIGILLIALSAPVRRQFVWGRVAA